MTPEQFVYWLQGYFEVTGKIDTVEPIDAVAASTIKEHLQTVFNKVTTNYGRVQPIGTSSSIGKAGTC